MSKNFASVILAAGEGTRMKSSYPKVLHSLGGKAMVEHVLDTTLRIGLDRQVLVVGFAGDQVKSFVQAIPAYRGVKIVFQEKRLGSGHAVMQAARAFAGYSGHILVLCADVPLIKPETLRRLMARHIQQKNAATVLTTAVADPAGYGRIIRSRDQSVLKIMEEKDASPEERAIKEINSGIYCFQSRSLFKVLQRIKPDNRKKEYYLTDAIELLRRENGRVGAMLSADSLELQGVNNRQQLAEAGAEMKRRRLNYLMAGGVTIIDPATTWIDGTTQVGKDTIIYPGCLIQGQTRIGRGCVIGPNTLIKNSVLGAGVEVKASFIYEAVLGPQVRVGPFAHIRPKTIVAAGAKIGNFVEIKKSRIGRNSKVSHLTYIGDTVMGAGINIGAGVITCNYDGVKKHETQIADGAFVGSNVNLVAPVRIGAGAVIGAGSTITADVPPRALALARARQVNKDNWVKKQK
jgi:bifunctional UDP-N-acetylglucosamine pyrophosphorylase / glucosamine-1-phosphate N-acetyltransferase